eukprot:gene8836-6219_t
MLCGTRCSSDEMKLTDFTIVWLPLFTTQGVLQWSHYSYLLLFELLFIFFIYVYYIYIFFVLFIYIYIYIARERNIERKERAREHNLLSSPHYIFSGE